ncbi:MAG: hypothetical protein ACJ73Z_06335 [Rubrobacteraceae bacterium]
MYRMNAIEFWNGRRHELVREAEDGRLAWRLRAASPKRVARRSGSPAEAGRPDPERALRANPGTPPRAEQRTGMRSGSI